MERRWQGIYPEKCEFVQYLSQTTKYLLVLLFFFHLGNCSCFYQSYVQKTHLAIALCVFIFSDTYLPVLIFFLWVTLLLLCREIMRKGFKSSFLAAFEEAGSVEEKKWRSFWEMDSKRLRLNSCELQQRKLQLDIRKFSSDSEYG